MELPRESRTVEYKREIQDYASIARTVVAFANGLGGEIVVGVEDRSLNVVGLSSTTVDEMLERLPVSLADQISPALFTSVFTRTLGGREVVIVQVFPGPQKPYYVAKDGLENGVYIRVGAHTRRATGELLEELRLQRLHMSYDEAPMPNCQVDELDLKLLPANLRSEKNLFALDIMKREPVSGVVQPSRGGVLMLHEHPERYVPEAEVIVSRMRGDAGRSTLETHTISGPLSLQAEQILALLSQWLGYHPEFVKGRYLNQKLKLPFEALREAVHNALFHRQYSIPGAMKIALYSDRLEVFSPGHFAGPFVPESLGDGSSYIRNRVICGLARRMGLIEKRGTGIMAIVSSMKNQGLSAPVFSEGANFFKVVLPLSPLAPSADVVSSEDVVLSLFDNVAEISSGDVCARLAVSKATAVSVLDRLIQAGKIQRQGRGPRTRYKLL